MKVEIVIDENCTEARLVVFTREITPEIHELVNKISEPQSQFLIGYGDGKLEIFASENIIRIYASQQKVFVQMDDATFSLRLRLYEVEEKLDPKVFVRISNSEIVNFRKVKNLDMSFGGTICIVFQSGGRSYVSRRYVAKIKDYLGL